MSDERVPIRLAPIRAGLWGRNILRTIQGLDCGDLSCVASRNPDTASLLGPGCRVLADWRAVLNPQLIDGVVIATPPAMHFEMAMAALKARLPVFVEKPLTMALGEATSLLDAARRAKTLVFVDHLYLFHPVYRELKRRIGGRVPRTIRATAGNRGPFRPDVPVLWDWGPHDIAMCLDLLGADARVVAACHAEKREVGSGMGEIIDLHLEFRHSVDVRIRLGNLWDDRTRSFSVHFDEEVLVFDDRALDKLVRLPMAAEQDRPAKDGEVIAVETSLPLTNAIREFSCAIAEGCFDLSHLRLGVDTVRLLAECERRLSGAEAAGQA